MTRYVVQAFNRTTVRWAPINDGYPTYRDAESVAYRLYSQSDRALSFRVVEVVSPPPLPDYAI